MDDVILQFFFQNLLRTKTRHSVKLAHFRVKSRLNVPARK